MPADPVTTRSSRRPVAGGVAKALCVGVLLVLHAVGGFFLLNALLTEAEGPWDSTVTGTARLMAVLAVATELLAAAATAAFVALVNLRRGWYVLPVVIVLAALARTVFPPVP
ncbi:hypothetical protein [Streptomyces sp. NPDC005805]|uniref:hypothetical protein n=1 Tax=Streptomyces sp. NPDC005805 TaxID=3157068 RepID=UPI0033F9C531